MAFVFVHLLQHDLDEFVQDWNSHIIRRSNHNTVSGRPDDLYYLPHLYGELYETLLSQNELYHKKL